MNPETVTEAPSVAAKNSSRQIDQTDDDSFDLTIEAGRAEINYWFDLWRYRELFYILAWRDISVRYKQTSIGVAWALLQPFLTMLVMTLVFGRMASLPSEGTAPYAIMVFAAMLPWMFFSSALSSASQSLVGNANLISKVYFPRLIIPGSAIVTALADFLISFVILIAIMGWYGFAPGWRMVTLPLFVLMAFLASLGPSLFITALNVKFRDFRYVIPFMVQFGLYVSPVGYSSSLMHQKLGDNLFLLYSLNPMVGVIDGFRWAILGGNVEIYLPGFFLSLIVTGFFLCLGIIYFRKTEKSFADII
ncbi:MAG: o-antigen export system permease protein [Chthoniobacteraceae bacterium]|nr:o-antigen export system permease protein [Chthoniobacteraceae bacterium]